MSARDTIRAKLGFARSKQSTWARSARRSAASIVAEELVGHSSMNQHEYNPGRKRGSHHDCDRCDDPRNNCDPAHGRSDGRSDVRPGRLHADHAFVGRISA
jgi:hypothetical protein